MGVTLPFKRKKKNCFGSKKSYQQSWFKNYILKYEHAVSMYKNYSTSACSALSRLASMEITGKWSWVRTEVQCPNTVWVFP